MKYVLLREVTQKISENRELELTDCVVDEVNNYINNYNIGDTKIEVDAEDIINILFAAGEEVEDVLVIGPRDERRLFTLVQEIIDDMLWDANPYVYNSEVIEVYNEYDME